MMTKKSRQTTKGEIVWFVCDKDKGQDVFKSHGHGHWKPTCTCEHNKNAMHHNQSAWVRRQQPTYPSL